MFVLNIIVLIVAAALTAIQAYKEYKNNNDIRLLGGIMILLFIGLVMSIVSELLKRDSELAEAKDREEKHIALLTRADSTLREVKSVLDTSNRVLTNTESSITQLNELQSSSTNLNNGLAKQLQIQVKTNQEAKNILQRSEKSIELLNQSINEQTGGNSFCYVDISIKPYWDKNANIHEKPRFIETIVLHNDGEYSLRNMHIEIQKPYIAFQHLRKNIPLEPWVATPLQQEYFVPKKSMFPIYEGFVPDSLLEKDELVYDIHFFLGNGNQYTQVIKLAKAHGGWPQASKIIDSSNPAYIYEYVHPLYPHKPVDWNYLRPMMNTYRK